MTAQAIVAQGTVFEIGNADSPLTYTVIKDVASFSGFDGSASEIDVTHLGSTAKEFLMGLQDYGNFSMEVSFKESDPGQRLLRVAKGAATKRNFRITFSDGSKALFQAFVLSISAAGAVDAKIDSSVNLRITGDVTFEAAP